MTNEELAKGVYLGQNELVGELYLQNRGIIYKYALAYYNRHSERCTACGIELEDLLNQAFFVIPTVVSTYNEQNPEDYKFLAFLKYPLLNCFNELTGYRTKAGRREPLNYSTSIDEPVPGTDDLCVGDTIEDMDADFEDDVLSSVALSGVMDAVKDALKDRAGYYDVIRMRYVMNMSQRAIAEKIGCSGSYIHEVISKSMRLLRHPKNKYIMSFKDDIIGATYNNSGLGRFRRTNQSSVEWAVLEIEKEETKRHQ